MQSNNNSDTKTDFFTKIVDASLIVVTLCFIVVVCIFFHYL